MIVIDGKTFYNLEEAVQKNMCDIRALKYGLKIVGQVDNVPSLPGDAEVGDCYLVGKERPYYFYVKIGEPKTYLNLGTLESTVPGPKGDNGLKGDPGVRGSYWKVGTKEPSIIGGENTGDCYLNVFSGLVYYFVESKWVLYGSLKGPQGPQGDKGEVGPQGPQGPRGPRGEQGEMGSTFIIRGIVESTTDLPTPPAEPTDVYLIDNLGVYEMWVWADMLWTNLGAITNVGPKVVAVPGARSEDFLHEITVGDKTYYVGADDFVDQLELKTDHTMLDWGVGPELVETKHDFYTAVGKVFVNSPRQSIYMFGTPADLATFFSIWGKPQGLTATHAFIAILPLSNKSSRVSFKMYLSSSNTGQVYEMTVSGYNGSYIKDSGWYNTVESIADIYDRLQYHDEDISRIDSMLAEFISQQDIQDKRLRNLDTEVAAINDKINATIVTPVKETFEGSPVRIPQTVKIDGTSYTVLNNQLFILSKIIGSTIVSDQDNTFIDSGVSTIDSFDNEQGTRIDSTIDFDAVLRGAGKYGDELVVVKNNLGLYDLQKIVVMKEVDLGTLSWNNRPDIGPGTLSTNQLENDYKAPTYGENNYLLSDYYTCLPSNDDVKLVNNSIKILTTNRTLLIRDDIGEGNLSGKKILYPLATPLPPETIATNLTLADISVLAKQGGHLVINPKSGNSVPPYGTEWEFNIKYWKEA